MSTEDDDFDFEDAPKTLDPAPVQPTTPAPDAPATRPGKAKAATVAPSPAVAAPAVETQGKPNKEPEGKKTETVNELPHNRISKNIRVKGDFHAIVNGLPIKYKNGTLIKAGSMTLGKLKTLVDRGFRYEED